MDRTMILSALAVLLLVVILFCLNAHGRRRQRRLAEDATIAEDDQQERAMKAAQRKGLDQATIEALPIFIYKRNEEYESFEILQGSAAAYNGEACSSKLDIDCPVCLSEFQHEERVRVLPNCKHRFHVDCIDTWLLSNATCPVCRASCGAGENAEVALQVINDLHASVNNNMGIQYPTNVLFWGSSSRVSSRVRIDGLQRAPAASSSIQVYTQELPLHAAPSPLSSSPSPSLSSTISTLSPLRRLLSRERRRLPPSAHIVSPPIGTHSHIVFEISIPKA